MADKKKGSRGAGVAQPVKVYVFARPKGHFNPLRLADPTPGNHPGIVMPDVAHRIAVEARNRTIVLDPNGSHSTWAPQLRTLLEAIYRKVRKPKDPRLLRANAPASCWDEKTRQWVPGKCTSLVMRFGSSNYKIDGARRATWQLIVEIQTPRPTS